MLFNFFNVGGGCCVGCAWFKIRDLRQVDPARNGWRGREQLVLELGLRWGSHKSISQLLLLQQSTVSHAYHLYSPHCFQNFHSRRLDPYAGLHSEGPGPTKRQSRTAVFHLKARAKSQQELVQAPSLLGTFTERDGMLCKSCRGHSRRQKPAIVGRRRQLHVNRSVRTSQVGHPVSLGTRHSQSPH